MTPRNGIIGAFGLCHMPANFDYNVPPSGGCGGPGQHLPGLCGWDAGFLTAQLTALQDRRAGGFRMGQQRLPKYLFTTLPVTPP